LALLISEACRRLAIRSLPNDAGIRVDTTASRVVFVEGSDATGELIFTDQTDAEVSYTHRETDPEKFPPDFVSALSHYSWREDRPACGWW
jgi:hypothetical protein